MVETVLHQVEKSTFLISFVSIGVRIWVVSDTDNTLYGKEDEMYNF